LFVRESNEGLIEHYSDTGAGGLNNARPTVGDRRQPNVGFVFKVFFSYLKVIFNVRKPPDWWLLFFKTTPYYG